jgi:hypothetical protein
MTTELIIVAIFCYVDDQMPDMDKHPQAVICRTIIARGSPSKVSQGSPGKVYRAQIVGQSVPGTDEPT